MFLHTHKIWHEGKWQNFHLWENDPFKVNIYIILIQTEKKNKPFMGLFGIILDLKFKVLSAFGHCW